ncbi:MAG: response regulator [Pseudobdellovibrionaceae bacterium]|nr:response regulator [Bdellovibrionales bacterium]USN47172.1 MAG: response regulator [Pseudobdellovibrionaceae bacterium]
MVKKPTLDTRDLLNKIERLTQERMSQEEVVSLAEYRSLKNQVEPPSILVIEDDETMRKSLRRIFESEGYRVTTAADGTQLSQVLDVAPIDLIVLDVGLPWINGFELAKLMKEHDQLKHLPLVFVSGRSSEEDVKKGFELGADDYIKKPFDIEKIKKSISTLLKLHS